MDETLFAILGLVCLAGVLFLGLATVVVGTILQKPFGVNFKAVQCPRCGEPAPRVRTPANWRQTLWGGCTCSQCGCEYDKWGKAIEG